MNLVAGCIPEIEPCTALHRGASGTLNLRRNTMTRGRAIEWIMEQLYSRQVGESIAYDSKSSTMPVFITFREKDFVVEVGPMSFEVSYRRFDGIARDMTKIYIRVFVGNGKVMPIAIDI
jgi:hypothetical protein